MLARMSLAQEVSLMHGGGLNAGPAGTTGASEAIPALKIPAVNQEDGPGGVGDFETGVTQLPAPIALAATFDRAAARCYGQVIGTEARAKGIELMYGPTVNLVRVPQWGRAFESLGEDPLLSGTLGAAEISGTQSAGVMAEAKHFAVYNQETARNTPADDAIVASRPLQELYLKLWRYVAAAHPAAIMCSYSTINHQPACQDRALIRGFLDRLRGFDGFVGSDYLATKSTVASAKAGLDQEQPSPRYFGKRLIAAVHSGRVSRRVVDEAVLRVLTQMYRFRLFSDYPTGNSHSAVPLTADAKVAQAVAAQGTVLLKNSGSALPLPKSGSVAVIGPAAAGETASSGGGTASVQSPGTVTPVAGLRAAAPPGVSISYTPGLPTTSQLSPIPGTDLSPSYPAGGPGGAFHATLNAPKTGTYILGLKSSLYFVPTSLSIDGHAILTNPDSHPLGTYTAAVNLVAGHRYSLSISGPSTALTWATPSVVAPRISAASQAAASASTAVVVVADGQESEAADRATLSLPSAQDQLVAAVAAANPRTVVVVQAGAAVSMPWLSSAASVVDQWYPGQVDGTALADVLFGAVDPSGHLPVTFPAASSAGLSTPASTPTSSGSASPVGTPRQFPGVHGLVHYTEGLNVGYRWWEDTGHQPLFPFGYGLSYTQFHYAKPSVRVSRGPGGPVVTVRAPVANVGSRRGADVAQVYLAAPSGAGEPKRQLEAYRRISPRPGLLALATFKLRGLQLADYRNGHWQVPAGRYRVYVGDSSATAQLSPPATFSLP
jgi:beta-glucosidase